MSQRRRLNVLIGSVIIRTAGKTVTLEYGPEEDFLCDDQIMRPSPNRIMRQSFMIALGLFFAAVPSFADEPPKLEPISSRLIGRLQHSNQGKDTVDWIVEIHFSPDGKRLIAGDYPGGAVNVWDVGSGKRLATMDTGFGFRA